MSGFRSSIEQVHGRCYTKLSGPAAAPHKAADVPGVWLYLQNQESFQFLCDPKKSGSDVPPKSGR